MARSKLNGCHLYITKYTNDEMDPLMKRIIAKMGAKGYLTIDKLNLIIAGGKEGYYAENTDDTLIAIASRCYGGAVSDSEIEKILRFATDIGYYDKNLVDNERIFTSRELQIMHFEAGIKREETYIMSKYSCLSKADIKDLNLIKRGEKILKDAKKIVKNGISSPSNEITSGSNEIKGGRNNQKGGNYLHKEKERKEKKKKEEETIGNDSKLDEIKSSGNCNGNGNSDSKVKRTESSSLDEGRHRVTRGLLSYNLIPDDEITLSALDNALFDLNAKYRSGNVINAGYKVMQTLLARGEYNEIDPIRDPVAYITNAIETILTPPEPSEESTDEDLSDSEKLEQLKQARKKRSDSNA